MADIEPPIELTLTQMVQFLFKFQKDNFDIVHEALHQIKNEQQEQSKRIDVIGTTIAEIKGWYIQNTSEALEQEIIEPEIMMTSQEETSEAVRNILGDSRSSNYEDAEITLKQEPSSQSQPKSKAKKKSSVQQVEQFNLKSGETSKPQQASRKRKAEDEDPTELHCSDCDRTFKRGNGEYTRHIDENNCKPHPCTHCDKRFKTNQSLKNHELTHLTGNFQCDRCPSVFKCELYLKRHMNRVHNKENQPEQKTIQSRKKSKQNVPQFLDGSIYNHPLTNVNVQLSPSDI